MDTQETVGVVRFRGYISRFRYRKPATSFGVASFRVRDGEGLENQEITVVGLGLAAFTEQDSLEIRGEWEESTYGKQVKVTNIFRSKPASASDWVTYLVQNISGVGKKKAEVVVAHFGADRIEEILDKNPERIFEVKGLKQNSGQKFIKTWQEDYPNRSLGMMLAELGLSGALGKRVIEFFGPQTGHIVQNNPYKLILVTGIGFKRADEIARRQGITADSPDRADAAVMAMLDQEAKDGHCFVAVGALIDKVVHEFEVGIEMTREAVKRLGQPGQKNAPIIVQKIPAKGTNLPPVPIAYLRRYYLAEERVAANVHRLLTALPTSRLSAAEVEQAISTAEGHLKLQLNTLQREGVRATLTKQFCITTGRAGTGKTTAITILTEIARTLHMRFELAAPTGRAARRMTEATGVAAHTIHKLLEWDPVRNTFKCGLDCQLDLDLLILDEFSMVDLLLAADLFEAIPSGCCVLLVGDPNQLPSVGAGRVLADLIHSERVPVVDLVEIFRQAQQSLIVTNAHKILNGSHPVFYPDTSPAGSALTYNCYYQEIPKYLDPKKKGVDPERLKAILRLLVKEKIPERMGINPILDLQVLIPQKKGDCGIHEMSRFLQDVLNPRPADECVQIGLREYRVGDRVMVTRNNVKLELSNGDIGFIEKLNIEDKEMQIVVNGRQIAMDFKTCDELQPAYAVTVHKSQGSEFKVVILVILKEHWLMLQRNLLYTGWTRAKQLLIVLGQREAMVQAVRNKEAMSRNSLLVKRLRVQFRQSDVVSEDPKVA